MVLFADDVIPFFSDPAKHLRAVLQTITSFGKFTRYTINVSKSEILEIDSASTTVPWSELGFNIKIAPSHITYLGIKVGKSPNSLYSLNYS